MRHFIGASILGGLTAFTVSAQPPIGPYGYHQTQWKPYPGIQATHTITNAEPPLAEPPVAFTGPPAPPTIPANVSAPLPPTGTPVGLPMPSMPSMPKPIQAVGGKRILPPETSPTPEAPTRPFLPSDIVGKVTTPFAPIVMPPVVKPEEVPPAVLPEPLKLETPPEPKAQLGLPTPKR